MLVSVRLERRIRHDFPDPGSADEVMRILDAPRGGLRRARLRE
ncbi:hypothetical protein [Streptomyces sp. NPDC060194]